jgi:hypothetical protein
MQVSFVHFSRSMPGNSIIVWTFPVFGNLQVINRADSIKEAQILRSSAGKKSKFRQNWRFSVRTNSATPVNVLAESSYSRNACQGSYYSLQSTISCLQVLRKAKCLIQRPEFAHFRVMAHQRRLNQLLSELKPAPESIGTLKLGAITYDVPASLTPSRLARSSHLLDINDPVNVDNLHFILQKYLLGQDVFLVSQPGPYARRLAMTFARYLSHLSLRLANSPCSALQFNQQ